MTIDSNIINDLGTATSIPSNILNELVHKVNLCIGSSLHEAVLKKEPSTVLNIGIGTLSVSLQDMQCKFVPSQELKTIIKKCVLEKTDDLSIEIEQSIVDKLLKICNEVL